MSRDLNKDNKKLPKLEKALVFIVNLYSSTKD